MIPSRSKLNGKNIQYMLSRGRRFHGERFTLLYMIQPHRRHTYRGVHIAKKLNKRATTRNRLKRQIYAYIAKKSMHRLDRSGSVKVFVGINKRALPDITQKMNAVSSHEFDTLWQRYIDRDFSLFVQRTGIIAE